MLSVMPYTSGHNDWNKKVAKKYDLCSIGLSPKQIKIPKDCTKEEIEKCFGLIVNKNGYRYIECSNPKLIAML